MPVGFLSAKRPGNQNRNTHQNDSGLANISPIVVPKRNNTKKPTNPDKNLLIGDQNLYKNSDITQSPIEVPNKLKPIPKSQDVNHLATE